MQFLPLKIRTESAFEEAHPTLPWRDVVLTQRGDGRMNQARRYSYFCIYFNESRLDIDAFQDSSSELELFVS